MYELYKSSRKGKKWMVIDEKDNKIHFGAKGYEDYTTHKDPVRKKSYISRHKPNEQWNKKAINKPMFWSRWLLWNKPTIDDSIKDVEKRFNVIIIKPD